MMMTAQGLCYRYAGTTEDVLDQVSLTIAEGACIGLLGPNGAGKTTLMSLLCGLQAVQRGQVYFDGIPLARLPRRERMKISLVPQDLAFYPLLSVRDNMRFFAALYGVRDKKYLDLLLEESGLAAHRHKLARHLSGGLKRRLNFAIGRINTPQVMFLDEITVGIDPASRRFILESVAALTRQGVTVIYTSHYLQEIEMLCAHVALISQGRLMYHGSMDEVLRGHGKHALRLRVDPPLREDDLRTLTARLCGGDRVEIAPSSAYAAADQLCAFLQARGYTLRSLDDGTPSLETFYLNFLQECAAANADCAPQVLVG